MSKHRRAALMLGTQLAFKGDPSPLYADANLTRGLDYLQNTDIRVALRQGKWPSFPVRIFQSERDGIVRPANAKFLKSVFPRAEVMWVAGNEHVLPVAIPAQIDAAVADVLRCCCGQSGGKRISRSMRQTGAKGVK